MKVGLAQINNDFGGACYLPYSVGCLQAYAQKYSSQASKWEFLLPEFKRGPVNEASKRMDRADVACFSLYTWNKNISFEIMRRLKEIKPGIIIVAGGPQIPGPLNADPKRSERFLREHEYIDMVCHLEGEQVFQSILENVFGDWKNIPSISFLDENAKCFMTPMAPRLSQDKVHELPSPYLEGIFDPLMKAYPNQKWIHLYETNRGCPYSCTFCDWGSLVAAKVFKFNIDRAKQELDWVAEHKIKFMFCADANFGIFERDVELAQYASDVRAKFGFPEALSVQNAKNNVQDRVFRVQSILAKSGLNKGVTLAFQSRDPEVLKNIKRDNMPAEDFRTLQTRFTRAKIETYSDMIIALAGETYDSFANGVSDTIADGQHNRIQFGNLSDMPGAEMSDPEYKRKYGMVTKKVKAVTYHGVVYDPEWEVAEDEELVIATNTMPKEDWARSRAFAWMTALLHFDKILQIPLIVAKEICGVTYRELIEVFSECDSEDYPIILEIKNLFLEKAKSIQCGEVEYCTSPDRLNIWWPADEFVFINLVRGGKIGDFYKEAEFALLEFLNARHFGIKDILEDAVLLNRCLLKLPFLRNDDVVAVSHNILEFVESVKALEKIELQKKSSIYRIDRTSETWENWDDWMKRVVWWGNKKGAYLYGNIKTSEEIGGHY